MPKSFSLKEFPNPKYIDNIFTHPDIYEAQVQALEAYCSNYDENNKCVNVEYVKCTEYGRYFVKEPNVLSCTIMWNKIRATLFAESDYDIDVVNCHSEVLLTLLKNNTNYDIKNLEHYCLHRDDVIDSIEIEWGAINEYNIYNKDNKTKKDFVKSLFTIILYGGTIDTWKETFGISSNDFKLTAFVKDYIDEIQMNTNIIIGDKRFKDIVVSVKSLKIQEAKEKYKKKFKIEKFKLNNGALLSVILQEYETLIIEKAMNFMKGNNCIITSYNYDGFQIRKLDNIDELINNLNNHINNSFISHSREISPFKFENIKFIVKPFREGLDVRDLLILKSINFERKLMDQTNNFRIQKKYFEQFHCKIENPYCYIRNDENGIMFIKPDKLTSFYNNIHSDYKGTESFFIHEWTVRHQNMRTYCTFNYFPDASLCPVNCYNIWKPFPILKVPLDPNASTSKITDFIVTLLGKDCAEYVLNWFAHIVQYPARKTEICILLYGAQGCGKSTIGEYLLRKIIGLDKMIITSKADKMFGRFVNTQGKLLAVLNEASGKDTFNICDILKDAITCTTTEQEKKGIDTITITDYTNYIFTTNNINSVKIPEDDRRFMPIEINEELKNNKSYFKELYADLDNDLIMRNFYEELMKRDLSNVNLVADRPMTELRLDMMNMNRNCIKHFIDYWRKMLTQPSPILPCDNIMKKTMTSTDLYEHFNTFWTKQGRKEESKPNAVKFSVELKQFNKEVRFIRCNGSKFELID